MIIFDKLYNFFKRFTEKELQLYGALFLGGIVLIIIAFNVQLYRSSARLKQKISQLNYEREDRVKTVLARGAQIRQQQEEMNRLLSEDLDFKIAGYFNSVIKKLGLARKKVTETATQVDVDPLYRESSLSVRLEEMDLKELTEILQVFENNKRISIKQLDIITSIKKPNTVEVQLTIATMLLKAFGES